MTIAVVDASVLAAALLDSGPDGTWAERQVGSFDLAAPHLALVEASNVVRRATLLGEISETDGALAHVDLVDLDVSLFPFDPFARRIWELHKAVTAYDAWYVALAEALDCPLLTLDARLARAPGVHCRFLLPGP